MGSASGMAPEIPELGDDALRTYLYRIVTLNINRTCVTPKYTNAEFKASSLLYDKFRNRL